VKKGLHGTSLLVIDQLPHVDGPDSSQRNITVKQMKRGGSNKRVERDGLNPWQEANIEVEDSKHDDEENLSRAARQRHIDDSDSEEAQKIERQPIYADLESEMAEEDDVAALAIDGDDSLESNSWRPNDYSDLGSHRSVAQVFARLSRKDASGYEDSDIISMHV